MPNTYTVTFGDTAGGHTFVFPAAPGSGGNTMAGKMDALLSCMQKEQVSNSADFAAFVQANTLTITVTQP